MGTTAMVIEGALRANTPSVGEDETPFPFDDAMVRVLVVDDDPPIRQALRLLLEDDGLAVDEATDGRTALAILRNTSYQYVVLLDRMMPQLDGFDVLRSIAQDAHLLARHSCILLTATARGLPPA